MEFYIFNESMLGAKYLKDHLSYLQKTGGSPDSSTIKNTLADAIEVATQHSQNGCTMVITDENFEILKVIEAQVSKDKLLRISNSLKSISLANSNKNDTICSIGVIVSQLNIWLEENGGLQENRERFYREGSEKEKNAKRIRALILSKFRKKNGTINIEAAATSLNTSKSNLYKLMQIDNYKGSNYEINLLQSILEKLIRLD